jgi:16S rRNA (cytidine1402-2'-O)-methyltransferase
LKKKGGLGGHGYSIAPMSGILSIVATPIGNLGDLSPRAAQTLAQADVIACEDTRVARVLLSRVPERTRARLVAYHARNAAQRTPELVRAIASGARVALTTDAGMPGLSDPGHTLVAACAEAGVRIEVIPGPSAVTAALIASGLPTARFVFEGFLPRAAGALRRRLTELASEPRTIVFFESPHRLAATLRAMAEVLGARPGALARELTKVHEEVIRGSLDELAARFDDEQPRGEFTIVVGGAPASDELAASAVDLAADVNARVRAGEARKEAIAEVARARRVPKKVVYQAVLDER